MFNETTTPADNMYYNLIRVKFPINLNYDLFKLVYGFGFVYIHHLKYLEGFHPKPLTEFELLQLSNVVLSHRYIEFPYHIYTRILNILQQKLHLSPIALKKDWM